MPMIFTYIILFAVFVYALIKSGSVAVKSLLEISRYLKISEYILAFIVMAIATSLPEFFIGISSAVSETPVLSLGNVLGSNIFIGDEKGDFGQYKDNSMAYLKLKYSF